MKYLTLVENVIRRDNFAIIQVANTGFQIDSEVCQIAVVLADGKLAMSQYVKPFRGIPSAATARHGIGPGTVEAAPTWATVGHDLIDLLRGKEFVAYAAQATIRMIRQSYHVRGMEADYERLKRALAHPTATCVKLAYEEWSNAFLWDGIAKYVSLATARDWLGITAPNIPNAPGEVQIVYQLAKCLAEKERLLQDANVNRPN